MRSWKYQNGGLDTIAGPVDLTFPAEVVLFPCNIPQWLVSCPRQHE
jgi:hypothetical protein